VSNSALMTASWVEERLQDLQSGFRVSFWKASLQKIVKIVWGIRLCNDLKWKYLEDIWSCGWGLDSLLGWKCRNEREIEIIYSTSSVVPQFKLFTKFIGCKIRNCLGKAPGVKNWDFSARLTLQSKLLSKFKALKEMRQKGKLFSSELHVSV
jgi:hypothetical protein